MVRLEASGVYLSLKRETLDAVDQPERVKKRLIQDADSWDYDLYYCKN